MSKKNIPSHIYTFGRISRCRSQIESYWGLFLSKCQDIYDVYYEPRAYSIRYQWIPDFLIFDSEHRKYLAEVKYYPKWRPKQYRAAMNQLPKLDGVLLLSSGGKVKLYRDGYPVKRWIIMEWDDMLSLYRKNRKYAHLREGADTSHWRLFP